jgi:hypothetical protein
MIVIQSKRGGDRDRQQQGDPGECRWSFDHCCQYVHCKEKIKAAIQFKFPI